MTLIQMVYCFAALIWATTAFTVVCTINNFINGSRGWGYSMCGSNRIPHANNHKYDVYCWAICGFGCVMSILALIMVVAVAKVGL